MILNSVITSISQSNYPIGMFFFMLCEFEIKENFELLQQIN